MDKKEASRSDRATEPDLPPAPQVPKEELSPPPQVPREDLSPPPEVPAEDLSSDPEVQPQDLSAAPEVPDKEVSSPPQAPEASTAKDWTSDERTGKETLLITEDPAPRERTTMAPPSDTPVTISRDALYSRDSGLEETQGSEAERWSAASRTMTGGIAAATVVAVLALLFLRRHSPRNY